MPLSVAFRQRGQPSPDVYLEVQHPCRSCNSSSSPANAPAGVRRWEPVRESGNATSSRRHARAASCCRVEGGAPGAHGDGGRRRSNGRRSPGTRAWRGRRGTGRAACRRRAAATSRDPAIRPPAPTGVRVTGGGACAVWRACGRPCAARGRRCSIRPSTGPSSAVSAGTAGRTRSRRTGATCCVWPPAGRRGVAAGHQTDPADAGAVADLDLDDPAFPFRQARIHFSHRCDIPSDWLSGQSPI